MHRYQGGKNFAIESHICWGSTLVEISYQKIMIGSKFHHFGRELVPLSRSIRITKTLSIVVEPEQKICRHIPTYRLRTGTELDQTRYHHGRRSILISASRPAHITIARSMMINIYYRRTLEYFGIHRVHISKHFERSRITDKNRIVFFLRDFGKDS
jgi:hypothetical protein